MDFLKTEEATSPEAIFIGIENKNFILDQFSKALSSFESEGFESLFAGKKRKATAKLPKLQVSLKNQ